MHPPWNLSTVPARTPFDPSRSSSKATWELYGATTNTSSAVMGHVVPSRSIHCALGRSRLETINAKAESVSSLPMFREAYALCRCIVPVDGFFEWRAIRGARAKQPYAIAMKDAHPRSGWTVGELEAPPHRGMGANLRYHPNRLRASTSKSFAAGLRLHPELLRLRHPLTCGLVVLITGRACQGFLGGVHD
jgi:hypothetical protein